MRRLRLMTTILAAIAVIGAAVVVPLTPLAPASVAQAASFDPGNIISDSDFFNSTTMTTAQIETFLQSKGASCSNLYGYACLKDYTQTTTSKAAVSGRCKAFTGKANETAASIIYRVGQACGVNPQVIIVTLQKEQGLVTSDGPSSYMYRAAMGYGCPDTAACDSTYYGFFNQVYNAAYQFKTYALYPTSFNFRVGTFAIGYNPNAKCGAKSVKIANQATAGLYDYTPYTPNAAALANVGGLGDSCSSYGNLNFWRYWTSWFAGRSGATDGHLDGLALGGAVNGQLAATFTGWAFDPANPTASIPIQVSYAASTTAPLTTVTAQTGQPRADIQKSYPQAGPNTGFSGQIPLPGFGTYYLCVSAIRAAGAVALGCQSLTVKASGALDGASLTLGTNPSNGQPAIFVNASGWAIDPANPSAPPVVTVVLKSPTNPTGTQYTAASADSPVVVVSRPDIAAEYPGTGDQHGFSFTRQLSTTVALAGSSGASYTVCATATTTGDPLSLGCSTLQLGPSQPTGAVTAQIAPQGAGVALTMTGWGLDAGLASAAQPVDLTITGPGGFSASTTQTASLGSADWTSKFAGSGSNHGYSWTTPIPASGVGAYSACIVVHSLPAFQKPNSQPICQTVTLGASTPRGTLTAVHVVTQKGKPVVQVTGWAFDNALPAVDTAVGLTLTATGHAKKSVSVAASAAAPASAAGSGHGFSTSLPLSGKGSYKLCLFGHPIPQLASGSVQLKCQTVKFGPSNPKAKIGSITLGYSATTAAIKVTGWDIDAGAPLATATAHIAVTAPGGKRTVKLFAASGASTTVAKSYPSGGKMHGLNASIPIRTKGAYKVCFYAGGVPQLKGPTKLIACKTLTLKASKLTGAFTKATAKRSGSKRSIAVSGTAYDKTLPSTPVRLIVTATHGAKKVTARFTAGGAHKFSGSVAVSSTGSWRSCVTELGSAALGSATKSLGCRTVAVK